MKAALAAIPLLVAGGMAVLVWHMAARQRAEADFHAGLARSLQISSDDFEDRGDLPAACSCQGEGISPALEWTGLPPGTRSLVLLVTDEDLPSPSFPLFKIVHWVLYNIPTRISSLPSGVSSARLDELGIARGRNWSRETGYYPVCPVSGRHRYVFRLYALDVEAIHPRADNRSGVLEAMEDHVLAYGELSGFYAK